MLHPPSKYNMNYLSNFLAIRNAATATSSLPSSLSASPPPLLQPQPPKSNAEYDETQLDTISGSAGAKSFTIAAILGLKKKSAAAAAVAAMDTPQHKSNGGASHGCDMGARIRLRSGAVCDLGTELHMNHATHNLLQQSQNLSQHPLKAAFSAYENSADTRLLTQLGFGQHLNAMPQHPTQHLTHFHGTNGTNNNNNSNSNNNNNNAYTANGNAASALQSLQQQFHQKNSAFHATTTKEQKHKNGKRKESTIKIWNWLLLVKQITFAI